MKKNLSQSQIASFDVDAQYSFTPVCPDELPVPFGEDVVNELNNQATFAKYRVGSKEGHPLNAHWVADKEHPVLSKIDGDNMDVRWPKHCIPGTKGFELIAGLPHPQHYDFFVWKGIEPDMHPYGSCYHDLNNKLSTGVIEFLQQKGVKRVIVGGLATDYCVKNTVLQLLKADFEVVVNLGACRGLSPLTIKEAIQEMKSHGAYFIESSHELTDSHKKAVAR